MICAAENTNAQGKKKKKLFFMLIRCKCNVTKPSHRIQFVLKGNETTNEKRRDV